MTAALPAPWFEALPVFTKSLLQAGTTRITRAQAVAVLEDLIVLSREQRRFVIGGLPEPAVKGLAEEWWWQAHGGQEEPEAGQNGEPWRVWAIVAARGFGKTRAGAEWVWARAREGTDGDGRPIRIALVAASLDEVERVMVKGESGLLAVARCDEAPRWIASDGILHFPSGAEAHAFTAERPEKLRGPQHHYAWCDELAKWPHAEATWDNLMLGLRLGERPRTIVTTTPKPVPLLRRILDLPSCAPTQGRTDENPHLPADYRAAVEAMYGGTRLGRQELEGLLLEEFEGALWTREILDRWRGEPAVAEAPDPAEAKRRAELAAYAEAGLIVHGGDSHFRHGGAKPGSAARESDCPMRRVVVGLDPPASTGGNSCGIIVCAQDSEGVAYVLADLTAAGLSPEAWARRVANAATFYGATKVVAEKNQGGDMIASVLRAVDAGLPVRLVQATRSKAARAEPIALRFETGQARLAGRFPELEDQLCALTWSGYKGAGSPDRADAMVWAMTELFEKPRAEPRIRLL
jgi:phage terminase large subunit-like protein